MIDQNVAEIARQVFAEQTQQAGTDIMPNAVALAAETLGLWPVANAIRTLTVVGEASQRKVTYALAAVEDPVRLGRWFADLGENRVWRRSDGRVLTLLGFPSIVDSADYHGRRTLAWTWRGEVRKSGDRYGSSTSFAYPTTPADEGWKPDTDLPGVEWVLP